MQKNQTNFWLKIAAWAQLPAMTAIAFVMLHDLQMALNISAEMGAFALKAVALTSLIFAWGIAASLLAQGSPAICWAFLGVFVFTSAFAATYAGPGALNAEYFDPASLIKFGMCYLSLALGAIASGWCMLRSRKVGNEAIDPPALARVRRELQDAAASVGVVPAKSGHHAEGVAAKAPAGFPLFSASPLTQPDRAARVAALRLFPDKKAPISAEVEREEEQEAATTIVVPISRNSEFGTLAARERTPKQQETLTLVREMQVHRIAQFSIKYNRVAREAWLHVAELPESYREKFMDMIEASPKGDVFDMAASVLGEFEAASSPYRRIETVEYWKEAKSIGDRAEREFTEVIAALGEDLDLEALMADLRKKHARVAVPLVPAKTESDNGISRLRELMLAGQ